MDTINWLIVLVFVGVAGAAWWLVKPAAVFVVRIDHGAPVATHGKVSDAFLDLVAQLCREQGVQSGEIRGVARGRRVSLWFSTGLPRSFCQPLRNWWNISG